MKKLTLLFVLTFGVMVMAQETANRFIYEMTYKPKKDSARLEKQLMVLDISKSKSIYQDYTGIAQDSIMKDKVEKMQKAGMFDPDFSRSMKKPKISYRVNKQYPSMKVQYIEVLMSMGKFTPISYTEDLKFNWKVLPDKMKIGEYNAQKATTEFGGRTWTAWFSTDLPFQDGPYKFWGLPGLIVKIEDEGKNYSWVLQANKKVSNYEEKTFAEKTFMPNVTVANLSREKFDKTFSDYKKDPFGSMRQYLTPEAMKQKFPGSERTIGDLVKEGERDMDRLYNSIDNPIELTQGSVNMGKGTQEVVK
ncbi:GLPGLI family protein [Elizabethkingia meningoseptica]|uniref:GLPGLI family protein n=1 Tax=Elizabethkingia meningoseptica TaxID=238 RepID=UPI0023B01B76|nr:GLPGLI family protein [Elizabethkingia meningoseptica]MDE5437989.1 GLPGLI family protein [Elizabethkingia meningoseptica]MDE5508532.1 GLPGLI family protein [Elizabethkingia meningoseptica]MDE5516108.1 GLPGLI family protein [Elizabethkingia meningoseptica]MDE5526915.1 GLPGLI family protein [Elizabethkingia meningoseptica]MDE5531754.1 GLPGLI family protein [Elizabethkingia meningoseptica]